MLKWSKYFQTPQHLELYRAMIMDTDYKELIAKWIRLKNNCKILDVGCGTGAFISYLATETSGSNFIGVDIDNTFISYARKKSFPRSNQYDFLIGDACNLPFADESFDLVVSYTALTNIPNSTQVMSEMCRVVHRDGWISSVTTQGALYNPGFDGEYIAQDSSYYSEYRNLHYMILNAYEQVQPSSEYLIYGTEPHKIPLLFAKSGLQGIEMHAIGNAFSLSNTVLNLDRKKELIELDYICEYNKFSAFMELEAMRQLIDNKIKERYFFVLKERRDHLLKNIENNQAWEWTGGSQLLMCGQKSDKQSQYRT